MLNRGIIGWFIIVLLLLLLLHDLSVCILPSDVDESGDDDVNDENSRDGRVNVALVFGHLEIILKRENFHNLPF